MKLSAARVFVRDLAPSLQFYAGLLGLPLKAGGAGQGFLVLDLGGVDLVVESVPLDAPADEQILVGRFTGLSFAVQDMLASHAQLSAVGVRFTGAPELQAWGGILATFSDPEGNEMQLVQLPGAATPLASTGSGT